MSSNITQPVISSPSAPGFSGVQNHEQIQQGHLMTFTNLSKWVVRFTIGFRSGAVFISFCTPIWDRFVIQKLSIETWYADFAAATPNWIDALDTWWGKHHQSCFRCKSCYTYITHIIFGMCISLEDPWSGLRSLTFILTTLHRPEAGLLGPRTYALSSWGRWGLWPDAPSKLQENHPSTSQRARFASTIPERRRSRNPHASR